MFLNVYFRAHNSNIYRVLAHLLINTQEELQTKILELIDLRIENGDEIYYCDNHVEIYCDNGAQYQIYVS